MRALIFGVTGQDGSYLAEHLLEKGYEVYGVVRPSSLNSMQRIAHIKDQLLLHSGDVTDAYRVARLINDVCPHHVYNLADQDHVGKSRDNPALAVQVTYGGAANILEACYQKCSRWDIRVFQACSATMYGLKDRAIRIDDPLNPQSPYACAKAGAYLLAKHYRDRGLNVSCGILFGHDSPRRIGRDYLLQEIARKVVEARRNGEKSITLRGPDQSVSIGHAKEFAEQMCHILEMGLPEMMIAAPWTIIGMIVTLLGMDVKFDTRQLITWKNSIPDSEKCIKTKSSPIEVVQEILKELEK